MKSLAALLLCLLLPAAATAAPLALYYPVIEATVEPLQISHLGDPLAGGLVTELVLRLMRDEHEYQLRPVLAPSLRIQRELREQRISPWIGYGWREGGDELGLCAPTPITPWRTVLLRAAGQRLAEPVRAAQLRPLKLLLVHGFDYPGLDGLLQVNGGPLVEQRAPSPKAALQMLQLGRGDAVVEQQLRARYWLRQLPRPLDVEEQALDAVVPPTELCLRVDKAMPVALRERLFERLRQLQRSGELAALVKRYE